MGAGLATNPWRYCAVMAAAVAVVLVTMGCSDEASLPLAANYERGWTDGDAAGNCEILEQDNCILHHQWSHWDIDDWSFPEWERVTEVYDAGYNASASVAWQCAAANGLAAPNPRFSGGWISIANNPFNVNASWDGYAGCRERSYVNPYVKSE